MLRATLMTQGVSRWSVRYSWQTWISCTHGGGKAGLCAETRDWL